MKNKMRVIGAIGCFTILSIIMWAILDLPLWTPTHASDPRSAGLILLHAAGCVCFIIWVINKFGD